MYFTGNDLDDLSDYWNVGGDLSYKVGSTTFNLNPEFGFNKKSFVKDGDAESYFKLTPKVTIVF